MADIKQVNKSSDSKDKAAELAALIKMDVATVRAAQLDEESLSTLFNIAVNHKRLMDYFVRPTGYLAIVGLVTSFMVTKSVQDIANRRRRKPIDPPCQSLTGRDQRPSLPRRGFNCASFERIA